MSRAILPLFLVFAAVAACSLLYNPDRLAGGSASPDGDVGRGIIDAAVDPDADTPGDGAAPVDAVRNDAALVDAALVDASQHDAASRDAAIDAPRVDAASPDAAIDASPLDAPACGGTDEPCCSGPNPCEQWNECTAGACRACGALLQSCCDPGASCQFGVCLAGICT